MTKSEDDINLDGVLEEVGRFGRFQMRQYALMILPIIFNALFTLSYVFTAGNLNYRCVIPGCDDASQSAPYNPAWLNNTVPFKDGMPVQCERFVPISNESLERQYCDAIGSFNTSITVECSDFIYEDEEVTIVRDFDITCPQNDWKLTLVGTINNIGQFIALPIGGYISDRFGRRLILLLSVAGSAIFGVIRAYSMSYDMFLSMEFLDPAIGSTMYTTAFILALELAGPRMRVTGGFIISCSFAFGEALLGLLAMFFRNWRTLLKVVYYPGIVSLPLLWMTAESVRWLISKGYREKAFNLLQKAAHMNGRSISPATLAKYCPATDNDGVTGQSDEKSFFSALQHAFRNPGLVLRIVNCSFCWLTNVLVFYGLSLNSVTLAGDKYLNWILVCLIELPGYLMLLLILDRVGRKRTLCTSMVLCGLFCFLSEFVESGKQQSNKSPR